MDDQRSFGQRPMVSGQWQCADCGTTITELPFEPDGTKPIYCRDCYRKNKPARPMGGARKDFGSRPMVSGQWQCADCGTQITELPFEPDGTKPIYCRDCHRNRRPARPSRY
ncbi:MAG: CxxC-x17-CxxC domain-containing protein [Patescibacteria group bacterium]